LESQLNSTNRNYFADTGISLSIERVDCSLERYFDFNAIYILRYEGMPFFTLRIFKDKFLKRHLCTGRPIFGRYGQKLNSSFKLYRVLPIPHLIEFGLVILWIKRADSQICSFLHAIILHAL
jgi:hypothetical protein